MKIEFLKTAMLVNFNVCIHCILMKLNTKVLHVDGNSQQKGTSPIWALRPQVSVFLRVFTSLVLCDWFPSVKTCTFAVYLTNTASGFHRLSVLLVLWQNMCTKC